MAPTARLKEKASQLVTAAGATVQSVDEPKYVRGGPHGTRYEVVVHTTDGDRTVTLDRHAATDQINEGAAARQYAGRSYRVVGRISDISEGGAYTGQTKGGMPLNSPPSITVWPGAGMQQFTCPVTATVLVTLHKRDWVIAYGTLSVNGGKPDLDDCEMLWTGEKLPLTDAELSEAK